MTITLNSILKSKTIKHFSITSVGTVINGVLGLIFYVVVARSLGPADFGLLMITITAISLLSDIGDLGMDTGIVKFAAQYYSSNQRQALKFIKIGWLVKTFVWLLILTLGFFFAPYIAQNLFLKPQLALPLRLALIGVGGAMYFSLAAHSIQALQKYWAWSFLNIAMNGLRLGAVILLIILGLSDLNKTLLIYIAIPFLGFFLSLLILPVFLTEKIEKTAVKELFHYSKWVAILSLITAASSRLDTFLSGRLLTATEVGFYSAASQLAGVVPQAMFALAAVVGPKLASFDHDQKAFAYLKKLQLLVIGITFLGLLTIPLAFLFIPLVFGLSYQSSIGPFIILLIAQLVFLLALPAHQAIFYYFAKPRFFLWVSLGQLFISSVFGWFLISSLKITGAALTVLTANLFSLIISGLWVIFEFRRKR